MKRRILIVEDNADLRRLYAIGLNLRGYEVRLAANGAEAIDRVETEKPDLVILDLCMPVMDGWQFIDRLNPQGAPETVPILVITGHDKPTDRIIPPCVRGWLAKPASIDEVAVKLTEITLPPASH
ncbi:MAG TPA: response regulator [Thermoanaerobaculia bacterium]|nr:response regulator [Thermoanaerobaculia bacterium]